MQRADQAGRAADAIDQIDQMAGASKVRERSPEKFLEALQASGLEDTSFLVSAEGLQEYFQAKDVTFDDETLRAWGIEPDDFAEKVASGGDVAIPASNYAARIHGSEDSVWVRENAVFSPDEMSLSEAADFNSRIRDEMEKAFAEAEISAEMDRETRASDIQIYDQVFSDLRSAGRSPDVAKQEASIWSSFWRTMGERYGEDPLDLARSMGVQILGPQSPDVTRRRDKLDIMLNTLRAKGEKALAPRGAGVLDFVKSQGGIRDFGGDIEALDAPSGIISETQAQVRDRESQPSLGGAVDFNGRGKGLDEIGRAMIEAGYFPEYLGGVDVQSDGTVIDEAAIALEAISEAIAGRDRFIDGDGPDLDLVELAANLSERAIDLGLSNDEIMSALQDDVDGQQYDQSGRLLTDTPEFRAWFGDSQVVDENGEPLVMYHGTKSGEFDAFDAGAPAQTGRSAGEGFYFSSLEQMAETFARPDGRVMEVYLRLENPFTGLKQLTPAQMEVYRNAEDTNAVLAEMGFDGRMLNDDPSEVVVFEPTQIKSVNNRGTFDANDPRIMFQSGPEQPLAVAHNISARGLQIADEMGGLAAPSLGVVRADIGPLDGFGEITLIAGPELADPKQSGVRTFNADVYSVRQPRGLTDVSRKNKAAMEKKIDAAAAELGSTYFEIDSVDLERYGLGHLADQDAVRLAYLRAKGVPFKVKMKKRPSVSAKMKKILSGDIWSVRQDPEQMQAIKEQFTADAQELVDKFPDRFPDVNSTRFFDDDGEPNNNLVRDLVSKVQEAKSPVKVDRYETGNRLRKKIQGSAKAEASFLEWVEDEFGGLTGDLFFEDSRGRKKPYDLDSIVSFMKGQVRDAEGFNYGVGNIRSNMAREFKSISEVKGARSDIVTKSEFEAVKKEVGVEFDALLERLKPHLHGSDGFGFYNQASEFIGDLAKGNMRDWRGDNMVAPLTPELEADIRSFLRGLAVLPTEYFEVKMQRAVNFSGFSAALVPKSASKDTLALLKKHGIKVTRYDGNTEGGRAKAMAALNPKTFFQEKRGSIVLPRGGLTEGQTVINLFESADLSTFLHESGHFFLEAFTALATSDNAPQGMRDDLAVIHKFLKVEAGTTLQVEQHETWARGFEAYLMEGNAPSLELAGAFSRFKAWLTRIYKSAKGLNVRITPDIREVMDRMLATDAEIAAMREDLSMRPLFSEAPVGMSEHDFATYQRMARRGVEQAEQSLMKRTMEKVRRETLAWFKDEKSAVRKEVEANVNRMPVYRLTEAATNKVWLGDEARDAPDIQIDRNALVEQFGDGVIAELGRARLGGKRAIYAKNGESPQLVAEMFGFDNAVDMVEALQNAGKRKDYIAAEVDRIMVERHGDPLNDGSIEEAAALAVHSEQQAATVTAEARAIAKRLGRPTRDIKAKIYRQRARAMFGRMTVREAARSSSFLQAERRAAKTAEQAFAKVTRGGRNVEASLATAMQAKEQQLLNQFLYQEARDFEARLQRGREKMRSYDKKSVRDKLDGGYIDQIDALLERFDFRVRSKGQVDRNETLRDFIDRMIADGRGADLDIDDKLLNEARRVHYTKLSVDDLNGLFDTIANIDHMGRFKQRLIDRKRQRDLNESASKVAGLVRGRFGSGKSDKQTGAIKNMFNLLMRVDTIAADIDKEEMGVFYDEIKRGLDEGAALEQWMNADAAIEIDKLFSVYSSKEKADINKPKLIPGGNGKLWTKQQILALALNSGNDNNKQRILDPRVHPDVRLTQSQMDATLGALDKRDWDFVQSVWDYVDTYWPALSEVSERRTGNKVKRVEAQGFTNQHGSYRGGYYPIAYDPLKSKAAAQDAESAFDKFLSSGRGAAAKVADGMTKARQNTGGGRALNYDLSVMLRHVRDTTRVIAMSEPVDNAHRILNHEDVFTAFQDGGVTNLLDTLNLFLQDIGTGPVYNNDPINGLSRAIKNNFTLSRLAFNFKTVALQVTGLGQSAAVIGKLNLLKGFNEYRKRPLEVGAEIMQRSAFMAERQTTFQKDVYDQANDLRISSPLSSRGRKAKNLVSAAGFWPMIKTQFYVVDVPTWLGAYQAELARNGGKEDGAVHYADRMVDRSQGGGLMTDRNALERGTVSRNVRQSDFFRLWTTLGGYMVTKMNRGYLTTRQGAGAIADADTAAGKAAAAASMATDLVLLYVFEASMMGLAYSLLADGEDDDEVKAYIIKEIVGSGFGGIPFVRESVSAFNGYGAGGVLSSALEMPANVWQQVEQGDNDKAFRRSIGDLIGFGTGMPTTQSMRIIEELVEGDSGSFVEAMIGRNPLD